MAKYRILKREYLNGQIDYEVQKKILGLFWWNFENVDAITTGFYDTLEEAEIAIKMHKEKLKKTVIDAKIKAYTNIEQSRKLTEILPLESADMIFDGVGYELGIPKVKPGGYIKAPNTLPCWSLAALIGIIPKHIKEYNTLRIDIGEKDFSIWYDKIGYGVNTELPDITMESTVDACYELLLKLHELKIL